MSGMTSYLAGMAAEEAVARDYHRRGHSEIAARRWRGSGGELDLVLRDGAGLIVVEVKKARDFARAAARVTRAQYHRIAGAVSEFVAREPRGQLTDVRFDVALVDGSGRVQIIENVFV